MAHIGRVGSVFITVSITIERYLSVCHPTSAHCGKSLLLPIPVAFAIIYNIPKFFELEAIDANVSNAVPNRNDTDINIDPITPNSIIENISYADYDINVTYIIEDLGYRGTPMRLNPWYTLLYVFWSKFLLVEIIPWVTVIILNYRIWRQIREFQRARRSNLGKESGKTPIL